jgi:carboxymethylenebutenolidase
MTGTRRSFITTLVTGFTLATGPINAAAITTDSSGLDAGDVSIPVSDGHIPGYRARPSKTKNAPVILVVQEVFGVHEFIKDVCRRFAKLGYYAIAPALYARYGDPAKYDMAHVQQLVSDIVSKVPDNEVVMDLDSTVAFARTEGANAGRVGITGFCWGGRIVWLYAIHNPQLKAGVAWYGPLGGKPTHERPYSVIELAGHVQVPVLGNYGGKDLGIPPADVEAMRSALRSAGNTQSRIDVYEDSQHGFFADYRDSYNEKDANVAWANTVKWFADHGMK